MSKKRLSKVNPSVLSEMTSELCDINNSFGMHIARNLPKSGLPFVIEWPQPVIGLMVYLAVDIPYVIIKTLVKRISQRVKEIRRQKYYAAENERRRKLREERRKIRVRTTFGKCPTAKEFSDAWLKSKESLAAMLKFGGMVHDLACYVDSSLVFNPSRTKIIGRNGGIKSWIRENVPHLIPKYQTIMRYHIAAVKMRQFTAIKDPIPTQIIDESIDYQYMRTTDEEQEYASKKSLSVLKEIKKSLKFRYLPNKDLIAQSTRKWSQKAATKNNPSNEIFQKTMSKAINKALRMLRESIDSHINDYLTSINVAYKKRLDIAQKESQKCRLNKSLKTSKKKEFKIKPWRECKSWLYQVLDKDEGLVEKDELDKRKILI
jgi:hypothetical protein